VGGAQVGSGVTVVGVVGDGQLGVEAAQVDPQRPEVIHNTRG
jgi:thiamine monophosphate kinase